MPCGIRRDTRAHTYTASAAAAGLDAFGGALMQTALELEVWFRELRSQSQSNN